MSKLAHLRLRTVADRKETFTLKVYYKKWFFSWTSRAIITKFGQKRLLIHWIHHWNQVKIKGQKKARISGPHSLAAKILFLLWILTCYSTQIWFQFFWQRCEEQGQSGPGSWPCWPLKTRYRFWWWIQCLRGDCTSIFVVIDPLVQEKNNFLYRSFLPKYFDDFYQPLCKWMGTNCFVKFKNSRPDQPFFWPWHSRRGLGQLWHNSTVSLWNSSFGW